MISRLDQLEDIKDSLKKIEDSIDLTNPGSASENVCEKLSEINQSLDWTNQTSTAGMIHEELNWTKENSMAERLLNAIESLEQALGDKST